MNRNTIEATMKLKSCTYFDALRRMRKIVYVHFGLA